MAYLEIIYMPIFGSSLLSWLGVLALLLFVTVSLIGILVPKGKIKISFKWHGRIAKLALIVAIIHGGLAFIANM